MGAAWRITTMRAASSALLVLSGVVAPAAIPAGADCRPACTGLHAQLPGAALASADSHDEFRANIIKSRMERAWLPVGRTPSPTALGSDVKRSDSSVDAALESAATAAALSVPRGPRTKRQQHKQTQHRRYAVGRDAPAWNGRALAHVWLLAAQPLMSGDPAVDT